mmetsp:Transcript_29593/g.86199  ORF Transcript_29593/g.86199 Transcript_29593/m.86199 type:complete len:241 (-) Transcript_29593:5346-6068(-)
MPCSCGSMRSGHRDALHTMLPFSLETTSAGRKSEFHCATSASVVNIRRGSASSLMGIVMLVLVLVLLLLVLVLLSAPPALLPSPSLPASPPPPPPDPAAASRNSSRRNGLKTFSMRCCRKGLLNGPAYERKALARRTSPVRSLEFCLSVSTFSPHRSFSLLRALVSLWARFSLRSPRSTASIASCLLAVASSRSAVSFASLDLSSATCSVTVLSLELAEASCSLATRSACRFGSTVVTIS